MPVSRWIAALLAASLGCRDAAAPATHVFVAASAADAVEEALAACALDRPAVVVRGASSALARQLELGAPGDLFVSANTRWMDHLDAAGALADRRDLLANTLVVVGPAGTPPADSAAAALDGLGADRLAVGDPDHVPAGLYARQALTELGLWASVEPRLARAADARAALALVERGQAPLGIVYATDAAASAQVAVVAPVSPALHDAVRYPLGLLSGADDASQQAWRCLTGAAASSVFVAHGFGLP